MELYTRYGPALLRKAERMLGSRAEAQDLVHGLFVDLVARPPAAADLPYLYRALTNRCLNHLRDHRNQARLLADHEAAARSVHRTRLDDRVVDRQLLAQLCARTDEETLEMVVYHFVDDMSKEEVAALMGKSRKTVTRRLARISDELRALLPAEAP